MRSRQLCGLEVITILLAIAIAPFALLIGIPVFAYSFAQWRQLDSRNRRRWIRKGVIVAVPVVLLAYVMIYATLGLVLCDAAESGNVPLVKNLLAIGVSVNSKDVDRTPIQWATQGGHPEVISVLMEHGGVFNANDGLLSSVDQNSLSLAEFSLKHGAKVDCSYENGKTPLTVAAEDGHLEIVRLLINHGAAVNQVDGTGKTPLGMAVDEPVKRVLIEAGAKTMSSVR